MRAFQERQNALNAEQRRLEWQWAEYKKLSQNRRERGARYDHGRWSSGWQEGCGHRRGTCAVKSEWVTYDPNNPDHKHRPKGKSGGRRSNVIDLVHIVESTDPNRPYNPPYAKHPNRRVQERLDRQRDIGIELNQLEMERQGAIQVQNAEKMALIDKQFKDAEQRQMAAEKATARAMQAGGGHPEEIDTIRPPAKRHKSGAQHRFAPRRRSTARKHRRSPKGSVFRR